jgi:hypothetical protein
MHKVWNLARTLIAAGAICGAGGCVNLPPALERELECPAADAPDNFGNAGACAQSPPR